MADMDLEREQETAHPVLLPSFRGAALELQAVRDAEVVIAGPAECLAGETHILDPVTGASPTIAELEARGEPARVLTMGGTRFADAPFVKGFAPLYRVTMQSGRSFTATGGHRVFTDVGWTFVRDLVGGEILPVSEPIHPASSSGYGPSTHGRDVLRSSRTVQDSTAHCSAYRYRDDGQPPWVEGNDRGALPSRDDAREHTYGSRADDLAAGLARSHRGQSSGRPSSSDSVTHNESTAYVGWSASEQISRPSHVSCLSLSPPQRKLLLPRASSAASADCDSTLRPILRSDESLPALALHRLAVATIPFGQPQFSHSELRG